MKKEGEVIMKKKQVTVLIISFAFALSGCVTHLGPPQQDTAVKEAEAKILTYLETLCSEETGNRMPGTPGNDRAAAWLAGMLESFGIEPYGDGYGHMFSGWSNTFARSEIRITDESGNIRDLTQGIDFFISMGAGSFNTVVSKEAGNYQFLETEQTEENRTPDESSGINIIFTSPGYFYATVGSAAGSTNNNKTVYLSGEVYGMLLGGVFLSVEIVNEVQYDTKELYNIAGRIKGTDSKNCVVLSAHFDFPGDGGAIYFPAALDNASGTSALLYIAERLKGISEVQPFDFDIVIAFFNSEEFYFQKDDDEHTVGSRAFVSDLVNDYENIYNINIDCVGIGGGETYAGGKSLSAELDEAMVSFAERYGIVWDVDNEQPGDNLSFKDRGIPSVYFISSGWHNNIAHTTLDTYDKLARGQIALLSDMIVDFLVENRDRFYFADETEQTADQRVLLNQGTAAETAQFNAVLKKALAGENVSFYEDFYKEHPDVNQIFFTADEYMDINEKIADISTFGEYELRVRTGNFNTEKSDALVGWYIYVNKLTVDRDSQNNLSDLIIGPHFSDRELEQCNLVNLSGLDGYQAVILKENNQLDGFLYTDEKIRVKVSIGKITTTPYLNLFTIIPNEDINTVEALANFIKTINFNEFVEKWKLYVE